MKKLIILIAAFIALSSFAQVSSLKGTWQYAGGISNGKRYAAPDGYTQQRKYTKDKFEAFLIEKGEKPLKYESGNWTAHLTGAYNQNKETNSKRLYLQEELI